MDNATSAAIVVAGTAIVLAPINPQPIHDDEPKPAPAQQPLTPAAILLAHAETELAAKVRAALGMPGRRMRDDEGETARHVSVWSQYELNDLFERVGGTVTTRTVQRSTYGGETTWQATEVTVTVALPGIGNVEIFTDWDETSGGRDLPLMQAITPTPHILETVPARNGLCGYTRYAITAGAPLPNGHTIATVEDPHGSAWLVTDTQGAVHWLHKYGELRGYSDGETAFIEPEWSGWSSN